MTRTPSEETIRPPLPPPVNPPVLVISIFQSPADCAGWATDRWRPDCCAGAAAAMVMMRKNAHFIARILHRVEILDGLPRRPYTRFSKRMSVDPSLPTAIFQRETLQRSRQYGQHSN